MASITRRQLIGHAGLLLAAGAAGCRINTQPRFRDTPFTLGVASGDPLPDRVVLWTRLAPDPLNGGGMSPEGVRLRWEVASDERMRQIVRRGETLATPHYAHSVHVDVDGLRPSRHYYYRFTAAGFESPIGRTRTAPALDALPDRLHLAFASCQQWETGYFTAYDHMAAEDPDLILHLGDYIYESSGAGRRRPLVRPLPGGETITLEEYRNRYALYHTDESLQRAHQSTPFAVTWDDHEVENDYAADASEDGTPVEEFLARRAAAYQAYYEHLPIRLAAPPGGPDVRVYRRLVYGRLAELLLLDTRQYRASQPCGSGRSPLCPASLDESRTMLGAGQERWLFDRLAGSGARWNVLAQQILLAHMDLAPGAEQVYNTDKWAHYQASSGRLHRFLHERAVANPIVLTGDSHANWLNELKLDYRDPASAIVGVELGGTSISSGGDGQDLSPTVARWLPDNPHVKFANGRRGYVSCTITPSTWQADYRVVPYVTRPDAPVHTAASFIVENGRPGAERVRT